MFSTSLDTLYSASVFKLLDPELNAIVPTYPEDKGAACHVAFGAHHVGSTAFPSSDSRISSTKGHAILDILVVCPSGTTNVVAKKLEDQGYSRNNEYKVASCAELIVYDCDLPRYSEIVGLVPEADKPTIKRCMVVDRETGATFINATREWMDKFTSLNTEVRRDTSQLKVSYNEGGSYHNDLQSMFSKAEVYSTKVVSQYAGTVADEVGGWDTDTESDSPTGREMMTSVGIHTYN